jgi:ABC-type lipoprotein export system ATPase subunit
MVTHDYTLLPRFTRNLQIADGEIVQPDALNPGAQPGQQRQVPT